MLHDLSKLFLKNIIVEMWCAGLSGSVETTIANSDVVKVCRLII